MRPALLAFVSAATLTSALPVVATTGIALLGMPVLAMADDAAATDTLYRWREADGSLTYSPTAPTDGTPFDTVDPMTLRPRGAGTDEADGDRIEAASDDDTTETSPAGESSATNDEAAPGLGAANAPRRDAPGRNASGRPGAATSLQMPGASNKDQRCSELVKRVVSLEQRLATPLTPDAMDATVVQMSRYQQNVDRHCR